MKKRIKYISFDEAITVYQKTIEKSGGGLSGIRDKGGIESILEFIQNDDYYTDFVSKLSFLVYRICTGHYFMDGNKRVALTLGVYFLTKNEHYWAALQFMQRMEAIIYHIAASRIDSDLLNCIMKYIIKCEDFDDDLKLEIAKAIQE